ncbi:hypothetical protein BDR26DRAFT_867725 [Obelidium mucronatum]|nr:hypothetical protein BDR26DRAFT_867725 [Obelidium mucronatum]
MGGSRREVYKGVGALAVPTSQNVESGLIILLQEWGRNGTTTFLQASQIPPTSVSIPQLPPVRISHESLQTTQIQSIPIKAIVQHTSSSPILSTLQNDISTTTALVLLHSTTDISNADTLVLAPPPINLSKPEDPISAIKLEGIIGIAICTTVAFFAGLGVCFYCWRTVRSRTDSNLGEKFSAGFFSKVSRTRDFTSRRFAVLRDEQYPNVSVEIPYGNDIHITDHAIIEPSILKLTHQTSSDARISFQKESRRENTINSLLKMNQERSGTTSANSWFSARWNSRCSVVHEKLRAPLDISPTASPRFVG